MDVATLPLGQNNQFHDSNWTVRRDTAPTLSTMSFGFPLPSSTAEATDTAQPAPLSTNLDNVPETFDERPPMTAVPISSAGRRGSKSAAAGVIKRSSSTPNVRAQASADASDATASADKRRNKLGYHRTSVACGMCALIMHRYLLSVFLSPLSYLPQSDLFSLLTLSQSRPLPEEEDPMFTGSQ